ncbi:MAG: GNAT family acetyltransferase [Hyphomicrobiales bacterium]|nr:GNAT family acetyltransferase [Hyphomicrobiales bacterium]
MIEIRPLAGWPGSPPSAGDTQTLTALWERCGLTRPWNDPNADIRLASSCENAVILVGWQADAPIASVMTGHDGHRGTVYYVSVDPGHRGKGYGRLMMDAAEGWLRDKGIWKLNLMVRADNQAAVDFYRALGYAVEERIAMAKWLDPAKNPQNRQETA